MKINPKYGDKIISIPGTQVLDHLKDASEAELKVLIFALANPSASIKDISDATGFSHDDIHDALSAWKKRGAISVTGLGKKNAKAENNDTATEKDSVKKDGTETKETWEKDEKSNADSGTKVVLMSSTLPSYSSDQINKILEKNKETKALIDNCQQVLGKIMSIHEVEVILKLIDYLDLSPEFVLLLCTHCASINKTSLRYIEKTAVSLFDAGITEYESLEKYIENHTIAHSREGKMRKLLGIGDRSLTKKEKDAFLRWVSWGMPMEVIEKAFEITAENTKRFSMNYMNTVLERWYKEGLLTVDAVESSLESYKKGKSEAKASGGSFATEDFFEAALLRSYGDGGKGGSSATDK